MSFPGTITFWELEIPNSGCGIKPFCHPIIVHAALPLRTVYIVYVQRCAYPWVLTFLCILIFFFQLSLRGLHCHIAVITEFTNF